jgi:transposase
VISARAGASRRGRCARRHGRCGRPLLGQADQRGLKVAYVAEVALGMREGLRVRCGLRHLHRLARRPSITHANAPLTELGRLRLAQCVVDDGWPLRQAAERFQVSVSTAKRWADRYRELDSAGMADQSSRPLSSPRRTPTRTERRIIKVRLARRWGPTTPVANTLSSVTSIGRSRTNTTSRHQAAVLRP